MGRYHSTMHFKTDMDFVSWGDAISAEARQRNDDFIAKARAEIESWKREQGLEMDAVIDALTEVANMTTEEEARLNALILAEEAGS